MFARASYECFKGKKVLSDTGKIIKLLITPLLCTLCTILSVRLRKIDTSYSFSKNIKHYLIMPKFIFHWRYPS